MPYRVYNFTIASAATGSQTMFVGVHETAFLILSGMTQSAGGTNNETITIRGSAKTGETHANIQSMTITTFTVKGIYPMPYPGLPFMSIGSNTAVTSTASIDVVVYTDDL